MSTEPITPVPAPPVTPVAAQPPAITETQAFNMPLDELKAAAGLGGPGAAVSFESPQAQPPAPAPAPAQKYTITQDANGVTLTLAPEFGGEVYKGKDFAEAITKLAGAKADSNAYIKQLKNGQTTQEPAPTLDALMVDAANLSPEEEAEGQRFIQSIIQQSITPEMKLAMVAEAVGVPAEMLPAVMASVTQAVGDFGARTLEADFAKECPEYFATPENNAALVSYFPDGMGRYPTVGELKQAYTLGLYEGKIKPYTPPAQAVRAPVMPTAGTTPGAGDQNPWTMDLSVLKKQAGLG